MSRKPDSGCQIEVRVTPRSTRNKIELTEQGRVHIWTTAPPTDGQANAAVCEALAEAIDIAKTRVSLVRGGASRNKVLAVEGLSIEQVRTKLRG